MRHNDRSPSDRDAETSGGGAEAAREAIGALQEAVPKLSSAITEPEEATRRPAFLQRLTSAFARFAALEVAGAFLLLACAILALAWANSPWADSYEAFWETPVGIGSATVGLTLTLRDWVSDGLMAVFFFLVGLEIKRELLVGELASRQQAALPIAGALGGMLVPGLIYLALNLGGIGRHGWGIPMATDIAFALGVLALLGSRVPPTLRIFLAALAIADDIGAVLIIALFYSTDIAAWPLVAGLGCVALAAAANVIQARSPRVYGLLGAGAWVAFLLSGVHSTVAGVLMAMTIPARTRIRPAELLRRGEKLLRVFAAVRPQRDMLIDPRQQAAIAALERATEHAQTPLQRLERLLQPWVAFLIMPMFALANAGLHISGELLRALGEPLALGVALGLILGKPLGITIFAWAAVRLGLARQPADVRLPMIAAVGAIAGVGFTMSLLIAQLAFEGALLEHAKAGILLGSLVAGGAGFVALRRATARR